MRNAFFRKGCTAALMAAGALVAWPAAAQSAGGAPRPNYQAERAVCDNIQQDRAACIREAGAAAQASRQGNLTHADAQTYRQNALARCTLQPAQDRQACEQRVMGTGPTTIEGSVLGGGAIRETVTPVPVAPPPVSSTTTTFPPATYPPTSVPSTSVRPTVSPMPPAAPPQPAVGVSAQVSPTGNPPVAPSVVVPASPSSYTPATPGPRPYPPVSPAVVPVQ